MAQEQVAYAMLTDRYRSDGFLSPVPILTPDEAAQHRAAMEAAETELGSLHYKDKVHTILPSAFALATHPRVLDIVESLLGPDLLLYNAVYIIKEPGSEAHVSWHQDLTYWGLADDDAQVSMWLALAPATEDSGCMQMLPGSHRGGPIDHHNDPTDANVLLLGQRIAELDTSGSVFCPLQPGEASFHHGWTVHASPPNRSTDRRIGLNVQFLAPHNRVVTTDDASAIVVRGEDGCGFFATDPRPPDRRTPEAVEAWVARGDRMTANFQKGQS